MPPSTNSKTSFLTCSQRRNAKNRTSADTVDARDATETPRQQTRNTCNSTWMDSEWSSDIPDFA